MTETKSSSFVTRRARRRQAPPVDSLAAAQTGAETEADIAAAAGKIPARVLPNNKKPSDKDKKSPVGEIGGPSGPEPTRYGDWERKGVCVDF